MKVSAKIDYACRALLELSLHWPNSSPLQVHEVAKKQKIPIKFLVHILISLKQLGYVESIRGKKGGYILSKEPHDIKLSQVVRNFGGFGYSLDDKEKKKIGRHVMDAVWEEVDRVVLKKLDEVDFEMISNSKKRNDQIVMYEIWI